MNKKCARCDKTVYPIEELKCLDKAWHKQCFKCQSCGMTLNMRNYKGFNKEPFCDAHIPKAKHTTVAETPELKRIAENTKLQSNAKYHAEFEKTKGKLTQVADDPETLRIKANSKIISNAAYHGDFLKKAEMEQRRHLSNGNNASNNNEPTTKNVMVNKPIQDHDLNNVDKQNKVQQNYNIGSTRYGPQKLENAQYHSSVEDVSTKIPACLNRQSSTLIYSSDGGDLVTNTYNNDHMIGSIADYDPIKKQQAYNSINFTNSSDSKNFNLGRVYRAMYDYEAQDLDEVSFTDGDLIVNCAAIDDGWMTGVVQRTGESGMLPANYVQPAVI
ncbi:Nebulin repeat,SH3 domain,Zinc finger, LIM-type [Cinara cedri]|uniref:Nebulin repeat,SH3 domain,Zinc finger, LIM-type n=1 Tax=Cinara cedri TaxID=506608 RepID=A0A5E4NAB3_9HEMI|nr:Nebulin repeat,SH3 domain,Zinc finger, LIM-type [Cinara cedri]